MIRASVRPQSPSKPHAPARSAPSSAAPRKSALARAWIAWAVAVACVVGSPSLALAQEPDAFTQALEKGPFFAALAAFVGGLLVSLTPCVYPMIAITVSVFGARQSKSRREAMLLSTSFVMGIVVLFTTMLVVVALTGGVFGTVLQNQWVIAGISIIFVAMAASMFGAFEMVLPDSLMQRLSTVGGAGYGGAFMLGLVSGVIAAPCTGPVLTGIILWIGKTQSVFLGSIVGATFSLGLGVPFWLVGTFAVSLPKGGKWMLWVKSFFGIVLLVVALYFLQQAFPILAVLAQPGTTFFFAMLGVVALGLAIGAVHLSWDDGGLGVKLRKGVGIAMTVAAAFLAWVNFDMPDEPEAVEIVATNDGSTPSEPKKVLEWHDSEGAATELAKTENRPLLVDFTADWCAACKKLTKYTFSNPQVQETLSNFVAVKIDATDDEDPKVEALMKKYKVVGLPTVVIYDSKGDEAKRFNDFVEAKEFLAAVEGIQ